MDKGYFSINIESMKEKCYKKLELPKNVYFNNFSQSYEFCYKTCGTCEKPGNMIENNCLTCSPNYMREPKNNTHNCVERCKYLYYYDSLRQYSCTDEEQCPQDASLIIREKEKCVNKCSNDDTHTYQYNGECFSSCPNGTQPNLNNLCQIKDIQNCTTSDYILNLKETINQDNVKLAAKNYANEFQYTLNHISRYLSQKFSMILYKNSSCIDQLNLNATKIKYDSCIKQLKIDNNINENDEIIIAVIDIINDDYPITTFGFFNSITGEKLDASKSCSNKNVIMYENILNILNEDSLLNLIKDQKINIFDLNDKFYNDICFHFESPNKKDATLQDRIKTFYPNVTLCGNRCKNKGLNMTSMKIECDCAFQDLLSNNIFENDIIGDNILIKEAVQEIMEMISNLNIEVLTCYKDVFDFKYFKKNKGGFIILSLIFSQIFCFIYYYSVAYKKVIKFLYLLIEKYIFLKRRNKNKIIKKNPPKRNEKIKSKKKCKTQSGKKNKNVPFSKKEIKKNNSHKKKINLKSKIKNGIKELKLNIKNSNKFFLINLNNSKNTPEKIILNSQNYNKNRNKSKKNKNIILSNKIYKNKPNQNYYLIKNDESANEYFETSFDELDYDDATEEDKRTYCQYYREKIKEKQSFINSFIIYEPLRPKSIKISVFILTIDLYFLINGIFFSDSYISEIFNSTEKETLYNMISRSTDRFTYSIIVGNIIGYIIHLFFIEDIKVKKIILKKRERYIELKYEMVEIIKSVIIRIKLFTAINFIIIIFSWYYISCLNNVYPNIVKEWIISSIFIILINQILPFISTFLETSIRYLSIKFESEKLFKLSLLFA